MSGLRIYFSNILENAHYAREIEGAHLGPVRVRLGRNTDSEIVLASPFIAPLAAVIDGDGRDWQVTPLGKNGCTLDGHDIPAGLPTPIRHGQVMSIWPFNLMLDFMEQVEPTAAERRKELELSLSEMIRNIHVELLPRIRKPPENVVRHQADESLLEVERHLEDISVRLGVLDTANLPLIDLMARHCIRSDLLSRLISVVGAGPLKAWDDGDWSRLISKVSEREREFEQALDRIARQLNLFGCDLGSAIDRMDHDFWSLWENGSFTLDSRLVQYLALRYLKKEIKDIVFGYGPLEDLLRTPSISEIMVVDRERIYVERNGQLENSGRRFVSDAVTMSIIERIVSRVGRRIDKSQPMVDARLPDGSRVNAVIPPLALSGPCLTIRKFSRRRLSMDDLLEGGTLNRAAYEFLRAAVEARKNILISGGTGSGKTTLLNGLADFIPDRERIVTVEDTAELMLQKEHVVRLEVKERNAEGAGSYSIRDLVRNALRMRPDRIVVGECRGPEALDMLQAMNTGHDGSLTTIHASSTQDVILRLEVLVQLAANLPVESVHRQVASAIDLAVQLERGRDGRRRVTQITEFVGVDRDHGRLRTRDLFLVDPATDEIAPTGSLPTFMNDLVAAGGLRLDTFYR